MFCFGTFFFSDNFFSSLPFRIILFFSRPLFKFPPFYITFSLNGQTAPVVFSFSETQTTNMDLFLVYVFFFQFLFFLLNLSHRLSEMRNFFNLLVFALNKKAEAHRVCVCLFFSIRRDETTISDEYVNRIAIVCIT